MNKRFTLVFVLFFIFTAPIFSQVKSKVNKGKVKKEHRILKRSVKKGNKSLKNLEDNKALKNTAIRRTSDVYVQEIPSSPPGVVQVETAIPAFIGYTEKGPDVPTQISSMADYMNIFGGPSNDEIGEFEIDYDGNITSPSTLATPQYRMYYMLEMFFANGGGDCFIISVGHYSDDRYSVKNDEMQDGLALLNHEDLPTLILFPDATSSKNRDDPTDLYKAALAQCAARKDRFLICDVEEIDNDISRSAEEFRTSMGTNNLEFGAAYFPSLQTSLNYNYSEDKIQVKLKENDKTLVLKHTEESISEDSDKTEESLYHAENGIYRDSYQEINNIIHAKKLELPPSAAIAGVYANVDATRGVWKAPANVSLNMVQAPKLEIDDNAQENLNVSSTGKSINAIRSFS